LSTSGTGATSETTQHDPQLGLDRADLRRRAFPQTLRAGDDASSDTPMREGSGGCLVCGGAVSSSRARYCSRAHQQRSYRLRHQTRTVDLTRVRKALQRRGALVAHTIYECGGCGERFLGERRCGGCNLFARALGLGGPCSECDTLVLLDDLLGEGVVSTA